MTDSWKIDPADATPHEVYDGMLVSHKALKRDECIPCGAIVKMGFFFDGFGRHRDQDDPKTSRYSNICRLWEAHRDNDDSRRKDFPNQFWYPFYYSGLGTPLNKDAENSEIISGATKAGKSAVNLATKTATNTATKATGVSKILDIPKIPGKVAEKALSEAFDEMSWRPVARIHDDILKEANAIPAKAGRVLAFASESRWVARGKASVRAALYDIKKNPLKAAAVAVKSIAVDMGIDSIPFLRDSHAAAMVFGTGVHDRLQCALKQFEAAYRDVTSQMDKVQYIEVSVFGADRGGVIARAFVNELVRKYKQRTDLDLRIGGEWGKEGHPIEIRFLGLLDSVSSVMAANELLSMVPVIGMVKQHHGDRELAVPAIVQRCVHFAAAHELRFYQRLDSLEKTRGEQYLYPGTSEDITGGAPPGSLGFRGELQRIVLRDMLHEALMAGARLDTVLELGNYKPETYEKFSLAPSITQGNASYKIPDLISAYRELVPRKEGLDFTAHMEVFLRWLAVRYQSPAFRTLLNEPAEDLKRQHRETAQAAREAEDAYRAERQRTSFDREAMAAAWIRMSEAHDVERESLRNALGALQRPSMKVWDRIDEEAASQTRWLSTQAGIKRAADLAKTQPHDNYDMKNAADTLESMLMSPEALALATAWKEGATGMKPLPEKVMMLFDMLVHDTMLTSWHDHVLSPTLYFQTRATDTFGLTDEVEEAKQREQDETRAKRIDATPDMRESTRWSIQFPH
ncbi:DUF2235 domain-containing protein [Cupriavidus pauculus]|uniref:Uncharacterized protein n=1 Tax=Cupriavidus pauculus TaxID=82633 RepID=A0A3G8H6R4_9BURK|nr:DUF2235 domain-containing protein [Cupriavidus pauculus]AZG16116.1 hypothetical protein EHF44_22130 [Cupriavidus pauculus]